MAEENDYYKNILEAIIKNNDADVMAPILYLASVASTVKRCIRQDIKVFAKEWRIDLTTEDRFKQSIDEALSIVSGSRSDRYNALQEVYQNFNQKAALETYHECLWFIAKMIYQCSDQCLGDGGKPFYQLGIEIVHRMNFAFKNLYNTNLMAEWEVVRFIYFAADTDKIHLTRIRKWLENYLTAIPKHPMKET